MEKQLRIIQLSDLHIDDPECAVMGVDSRVRAKSLIDILPQLTISPNERHVVVLSGDLSEPSGVRWLYERLDDAGIRREDIITLMGNHDDPNHFKGFSLQVAPFACNYDTLCLLGIDTSSGTVGTDQIEWLSERLKEGEGRVFLLMHHPVLDCGDSLMDRKYPLRDRDQVKEVLVSSGREVIILCGHYHAAQKNVYENIVQYVSPAGHVQIRKVAEDFEVDSFMSGLRVVDIYEHRVDTFNVMLDA